MFPRLILVFLAGLATVMLGRTFWSPVGSSRDKPFCANTRRFLMAVAGILIYILVVSSIGYFSATVLFIPCAALLLGYRRPVPIAIATLGFCIFIYFVFVYLFERPLPSEIVLTRFP